MRSIRTRGFKTLYERLPEEVRREADEAYRRFNEDPSYPGLNFERLQGIPSPLYSARIGRRYRALAGQDNETWVWFWIGSHADYDKLLDRLR
jgi:hypothetical protein